MKKNKKILMIGTAITSIVAPVATVISCSSRNTNHNVNHSAIYNTANVSYGTFHTSIVNNYIVLNLSNYKQYTTYEQSTGALKIETDVVEITNVFKNGYIPDPSKPNVTLPIRSLTLPSTLKKIDDNAFENSQLTDLTIPDNVTTIGNLAFAGSLLTTLTLGASLQTIGDWAFIGAQLTSLTIPDNVTTIGDSAFLASELKTLTIPNSVTSIGNSAFFNSKLTSLTLGTSVQIIGNDAFICAQLTSLILPNSVIAIGQFAFSNSELTSLTISNSVTSIGNRPFQSIVNNSNTHVRMPAIFNSDSDKDKIFGVGHWDQIIFNWT